MDIQAIKDYIDEMLVTKELTKDDKFELLSGFEMTVNEHDSEDKELSNEYNDIIKYIKTKKKLL